MALLQVNVCIESELKIKDIMPNLDTNLETLYMSEEN